MDSQASAPEGSAKALLQSFSMIIVSEIGDKTFLIAAILAMRHPRLLVFSGAFGSLLLMSVLSAAMGQVLPALVPRTYTHVAASVLFLVFGAKMLLDARQMPAGGAKIREEIREAEDEIAEDDGATDHIALFALERGAVDAAALFPLDSLRPRNVLEGARNFCSLFLGPVFVQSFILTFLGEWGDRSQIATIVLSAAHNVYLVTLGTVVGHSCCTALAVVGGRYVSTKISVKRVTLGGATLFLLFGVLYLYEAFALTGELETAVSIHPPSPHLLA